MEGTMKTFDVYLPTSVGEGVVDRKVGKDNNMDLEKNSSGQPTK